MQQKKPQLSQIYTKKLLQEIKHGIYANSSRLPPETEIAEYFSISRTLVRDCLSILEREGFVSRKHGVETIINQHVLKIVTRVDLEEEFLSMVKDTNREPAISFVNHGITVADENIANKLLIDIGNTIIYSKRVITADNNPAIYCIDYISETLIRNKNYNSDVLDEPIFNFIEKYCDTEIFMDLSEIKAILADDELSKIFNINVGSPILYMDEVGYNLYGQPVLYSREYYKEGMFKHVILRKKI